MSTLHQTWDFSKITSTKEKKKLSQKERIAKLEEKVAKLTGDYTELHCKLVHQTRVRGGKWMGMSMGKELYAPEAVNLIMDYLDMCFEQPSDYYAIKPKPEPVEYEDEDDEA